MLHHAEWVCIQDHTGILSLVLLRETRSNNREFLWLMRSDHRTIRECQIHQNDYDESGKSS